MADPTPALPAASEDVAALPVELRRFADLDARLCDAARRIKILSYLAWPTSLRDEFLAS